MPSPCERVQPWDRLAVVAAAPAVGAWLAERRLAAKAAVLGAVLLAFFAAQFATWAFIA